LLNGVNKTVPLSSKLASDKATVGTDADKTFTERLSSVKIKAVKATFTYRRKLISIRIFHIRSMVTKAITHLHINLLSICKFPEDRHREGCVVPRRDNEIQFTGEHCYRKASARKECFRKVTENTTYILVYISRTKVG
jgi:hypothetical protein